jgi:DNA repair exonuclease SbcCD nuclease subunit
MYRALFTADVHAYNALPHARPSKEGRTDRLDDVLRVLKQVETYARDNCVNDLFILGDLFDKNLLDAVTLEETLWALSYWAKPGTRNLLVLPGNHEEAGRGSGRFAVDALELFGARVLRNGERFIVGDSTFWPVEYGSKESIEREIESIGLCDISPRSTPGMHVLLVHCPVLGASMGSDVCDDGVNPLLLTNDFDATLAGHFHTHQSFGEAGFYLGSPLQHSYRDCGEVRGFWDITFDAGVVRSTFVESVAPRFWVADGWGNFPVAIEDAKPGDYVRVDVACTHAEWKAEEARSREKVDKVRANGFHVDLVHVPVYHHEARAEGLSVKVGQERPTISGMVEAYLKEPGVVTGDLDPAELSRVGQEAVEAIRQEVSRGIV